MSREAAGSSLIGDDPFLCHPTIVEGAAEEMVGRWQRGERPLTEEYLDRFPELRCDPEAALELLAEELALRDEFGQPATIAELADRFPLWQAQVRALVQCHRVLGPQATLEFPAPGDAIGDFQLVAELGRGAHGRVYLCTQPSLGDRPVVLKLSSSTGHEHLSLARLQHTHIVPLYSAHEFVEEGLRGLCLPYFGGSNLADVLTKVAAGQGKATGNDILIALRAGSDQHTPPLPRSLAWESLARAAYTDVICWIGACLADGLQYAHDRGLLHLDIKPSNVLIAADGVPMLLDFHLARPPLHAGEFAPGWLGGTPGYMAPEQVAAVVSVRKGTGIPMPLDARTDVYALGIVLKEAIRAAKRNGKAPSIAPGLRDILDRCISNDPGDRYPTAAAVAVDLRRQLADLPLKGVANRSLVERWTKWRRRRPMTLPLMLALAAVLAAGIGYWLRSERHVERAEITIGEAETHLSHGRYVEAIQACRSGEILLDGVPLGKGLRNRLREMQRAAERGRAADDLHLLCEQVRPLYAAELLTSAQVHRFEPRCRELWAQREQIVASLSGQLNPDLEPRWRSDLLDLGILTANIGVWSASPDRASAAHGSALIILKEAEALLGPSGVLSLERARHARAIGMIREADDAAFKANSYPARNAWEHLVIGRAALGNGDLPRATREMNLALQLDPGSFWANFYNGTCRLRMGDPTEALASFSVCVSLEPQSAWCIHNRAIAHSELSRFDDALADFDRALLLDPTLGAALMGRATVHFRAGRFREALSDLAEALRVGIPPATVEYQKAIINLALNDRSAAQESLRNCLEHEPAHSAAKELLRRIEGNRP